MNFEDNDLIVKIRDEPYWTVSTKNKEPLDIFPLLLNGSIKFYNQYERDCLTTLTQIEQDSRLKYTNRAYRLNIARNKIAMLDIESCASKQTRDMLIQNVPHSYSEYSMSGKGVHLLFVIPEVVYKKHEEILRNKIVIKGPNRDDLPANDPNNKPQYELLLADHFITFTRNVIADDVLTNDYDDPEVIAKIDTFVTNLIDFSKTKASYAKSNIDIDVTQTQIEQNEVVQYIVANLPIDNLDWSFSVDLASVNNDLSRYEFNVARRLHIKIKENITSQLPFNDPFFHLAMPDVIDEKDIICAVYVLLSRYLEPRAKHLEKRNQMPWLLYVASKSYN